MPLLYGDSPPKPLKPVGNLEKRVLHSFILPPLLKAQSAIFSHVPRPRFSSLLGSGVIHGLYTYPENGGQTAFVRLKDPNLNGVSSRISELSNQRMCVTDCVRQPDHGRWGVGEQEWRSEGHSCQIRWERGPVSHK